MNMITVCTGKLHCATVTEARLNYEGSITIGIEMMRAAGIVPFQLLHINSMSNAVHWETYAIPGEEGQICLNGCPARLFQPGDKVIILSLAHIDAKDAWSVEQKVVHLDAKNTIRSIDVKKASPYAPKI